MDANGIPLLELLDLVLDLHPRCPADEDVDLLLVLVLVAEGQTKTGGDAAIAEPRLLEPQGHASHSELEIRRETEVRRLILGILEIEMCEIAHVVNYGC